MYTLDLESVPNRGGSKFQHHFYTDHFASSDVGQDPFLIECRDKKNCKIVNDDVWHFINQTEAVFLEVQEKYGKEWFPQMIDYWTYRGDPGLQEIAVSMALFQCTQSKNTLNFAKPIHLILVRIGIFIQK